MQDHSFRERFYGGKKKNVQKMTKLEIQSMRRHMPLARDQPQQQLNSVLLYNINQFINIHVAYVDSELFL